jgi:hypothetical protein
MIQQGSIVTVTESNHYFEGFQGEVVEIKKDSNADEAVGIRFAKNYGGSVARSPFDLKDGIVYLPADILREDAELTPENRAGNVFSSRNWFRVMFLKSPIDKKKLCMHRDCEEFREKRIMVNAWGTVLEVDVCTNHADAYHGKCVDEFPGREGA